MPELDSLLRLAAAVVGDSPIPHDRHIGDKRVVLVSVHVDLSSMSKNAAKRRQAREERKKASQSLPASDGSTPSLSQRAIGGAALVAAGISFLAAATFWPTVDADADTGPHEAAVAGTVGTPGTPTLLFDELLRPTPTPEPAPLELPTLQGAVTQTSALSLTGGLEESTLAPTPAAAPITQRSIINNVNITFYDCANQGFCGAMYNGRKVYEGAAACSWNLPIGTRFVIVGDPTHRIYTCEDRGLLPNTWVDIFWYHPNQGYSWQSVVGRYGTIEIVSMP